MKIIPVDQKKAFDNLDHDYLFELLENINIGQKMIKIIKNLYVMAKTTINMDGNLLGEIIIEKGIKQGDPLSMWLYTIAIQELFLIIKQDGNIKGYQLNIISKQEIKLRGYADDVKLI